MMKHYGILAYPAGHSKSPDMHNAAFRHLNIDATFERYEIPPEKLETFFDQNFRKERKIEGLAVSVPHKQAVLKLVDTVDEAAREIGAVNTTYWNGDKLYGTNTDYFGFSQALAEYYTVESKKILLLGAGGAARAVVYALLEERAEQVIVANRTEEKAREVAHHFGIQWKTMKDLHPEEYHLVINATVLGMEGKNKHLSPVPQNFWRAHLTAFDLVYSPKETQFLKEAKKSGAMAISGEKMLLYQGMEQFRIWTGKEAPEKVMEKTIYGK